MLKLLTTTAMLALLPALALAAEGDKAGHSNPPAVPGFDKQVPPPKQATAKIYPPSFPKIEHPNPGPKPAEKGKQFDAPLGSNSPELAPGQNDVEAVVAPPPPPQPHGMLQGTTLAHLGAIPKGWAECSQTHAAKACDQLSATNGLPEGAKWIVKLPDNGKVDDLNAFLDKVMSAKTDGAPQ